KLQLRVPSQVKLPASGGAISKGEFVTAIPTWLGLTILASNRSSKVIAGVGSAELITNSTPSDTCGAGLHPVHNPPRAATVGQISPRRQGGHRCLATQRKQDARAIRRLLQSALKGVSFRRSRLLTNFVTDSDKFMADTDY